MGHREAIRVDGIPEHDRDVLLNCVVNVVAEIRDELIKFSVRLRHVRLSLTTLLVVRRLRCTELVKTLCIGALILGVSLRLTRRQRRDLRLPSLMHCSELLLGTLKNLGVLLLPTQHA